jgi:hypothetical protein
MKGKKKLVVVVSSKLHSSEIHTLYVAEVQDYLWLQVLYII